MTAQEAAEATKNSQGDSLDKVFSAIRLESHLFGMDCVSVDVAVTVKEEQILKEMGYHVSVNREPGFHRIHTFVSWAHLL